MVAHYVHLARRAMAAGSAFQARPNRWGDRSILRWLGRRGQRWLRHIVRRGDFPARVVIPTYQQYGVCARQPEALRRVQVLINVDKQLVASAFK